MLRRLLKPWPGPCQRRYARLRRGGMRRGGRGRIGRCVLESVRGEVRLDDEVDDGE